MPSSGFWSYVHADDEAEQGRIRELSVDLAAQYTAITTEPIEIFFDRSSLAWGDDWEAKIEESVQATSFFIPVVTPRYLVSDACRRELQLFVRKAEALGLRELVLPVVWINVPELQETDPSDDLVVIIKRYQWVDWRSLRFEDRASGPYRKAVAELAQRLVDVNARLATAPPVPLVPLIQDEEEDTAPGSLDLMAAAEQAMPAWTGTLGEIEQELVSIAALAEQASTEMTAGEKQGKGFAARLTAARNFGRGLEPHAQRVEELGNEFTSHLYNVDAGIRAIFSQAASSRLSATEETEFDEFKNSIRSMAESSREGLGGLQAMVDVITPVESVSRDMRLPLQRLRKALTVMVEGQAVIDQWDRLAG